MLLSLRHSHTKLAQGADSPYNLVPAQALREPSDEQTPEELLGEMSPAYQSAKYLCTYVLLISPRKFSVLIWIFDLQTLY